MLAAVLFHGLLAGAVVGYALLNGLFPHNTWGGPTEAGAIEVKLVSSAMPLPADRPPNDNVLATERPSEAPAPPAPKALPTVDEKAIAIPDKVVAPKKPAEKKQEASKPINKPAPTQTAANKTPVRPQPTPKQDNRAQFGEQASSQMQRSTQPTTVSANGQVAITAGSRGFNYPFYIEGLRRKMLENLYRGEVDPRTPQGTRTYILFTLKRDGSLTDIRLDRASGSPTLDQACLRAARRVDTFGPLPSPASDPPPNVSYYCDKD